jgi:DNA mismatch repair protein MutS
MSADAMPVLARYLEMKRAHPDCLLFFRLGDFYELFFEDAERAAAALDITLTKRGKHEGVDVPMAGVPVHAADGYLARLIRQGFRVAVADQIEDPETARRRGNKGPLRRAVTRVVTPGTLTEDQLLDSRRHNHLAALAEVGGALALARVEVSTGDFAVGTVTVEGLAAALAALDPSELLLPDRLADRDDLGPALADWRARATPLPAVRFDSNAGRLRLEALHGVATLDGLGVFGRADHAAAGALIDYLDLTQQGRLPRLAPLRALAADATMRIDPATRRNLELTRTLAGERQGSLLAAVDLTVTGAGARTLAEWLANPLTDPAAIAERQDALAALVDRSGLRGELRDALRAMPDLERPLARLAVGRGGPRDLAALRDGLIQARAVALTLDQGLAAALAPIPMLDRLPAALREPGDLAEQLRAALADALPVLAREGGFIRPGHAPALDHQRELRDESRRLIADLQARYVAETGIASLKIRHNNLLGFFVEVPAAQTAKLGAGFRHRQTMAGAGRFGTDDLASLEQDVTRAADRALAMELDLFQALTDAVLAAAGAIANAARAAALVDVAAALAELAADRRWSRPTVDGSRMFRVVGGRHPVVEAALPEGPTAFVANDCELADGGRLWLLTGPNMAGKSTFLRQNALIAILAQAGAFVPATEAHVGVVDRLFSRVGAADDLARGRSTFMVEMVETAAILNQAGPNALVVLDEIGRGTATYDGLSIAWATVEHLHDRIGCRALFATHYHELTRLAGKLPHLACHTMTVREWRGEVRFLHRVAPGAADRSYGIHVARLAGLPRPVLARAEAVLRQLEAGGSARRAAVLDDLPLFEARAEPAPVPLAPSAVEEALAEADPDALTPRAALDLVYRLRALLASGKT